MSTQLKPCSHCGGTRFAQARYLNVTASVGKDPYRGGKSTELTMALVFCGQCGKTEIFMVDPAHAIERLSPCVEMLDAATVG